MVIFDSAYLSTDGKELTVTAHIDATLTPDDFIETIGIDTQDTYKKCGLSENAILKLEGSKLAPYLDEDKQVLNFTINVNNLFTYSKNTFNEDLLFFYVITNGDVPESLPCSMAGKTNVIPIYDATPFYKSTLNRIKSLSDCNIPTDFINFALLYNAFKSSLELGYFSEAIEIFNKWTKNIKTVVKSGCGCG